MQTFANVICGSEAHSLSRKSSLSSARMMKRKDDDQIAKVSSIVKASQDTKAQGSIAAFIV